MKILVTGAAGFIGFHLTKELVKYDFEIIGLDNLNNYYDPILKIARLKSAGILLEDKTINEYFTSTIYANYKFIKADIEDNETLNKIFAENNFDVACHLAAQAGVRYSLENPKAYINTNIVGFFNIVECCRIFRVKHFVYASSSSVYGNSNKTPFSEKDDVNQPVSLYASTKISNELMAHSYSISFKMQITGLRFFSVYGPWGRPDMAYYSFTKAIINKEPIKVFNHGKLKRDFTYIDDVIKRIIKVVENKKQILNDEPFHKLYNIGNNNPITLSSFIEIIESSIGISAIKEMMPMQLGDVIETNANNNEINNDYGFIPATKIQDGVNEFVKWYKQYHLND